MNEETTIGPVYREPQKGDWPETDLEYLGRCPVCEATKRTVAYIELQDRVFFSAPGKWTSWRCGSCEVLYLDPRPSVSSIGRAYESYYTHQSEGSMTEAKATLLKRLRRIVPNSYLNRRFGYRLRPALPLAALGLEWQSSRARATAHFYRHLPAPRLQEDCLLDIGCGNGHFLQIARDQLNYNVEGLEIDPRGRDAALKRGLKVHAGSIPGAGLKPGAYYQITLSHVLEHLHEPVLALQEVFEMLKPGGRVWISVPNSAAASIERFGSSSPWLDPPRHLVMYDTKSLRSLLVKTGFEDVTLYPGTGLHDWAFDWGWKIEKGLDPEQSDVTSLPDYRSFKKAVAREWPPRLDERSEVITMTGTRPG